MTATTLSLHSRPLSQIEAFGLLERSLLFAELSNVAYLRPENATATAEKIGLDQAEFIDRDGSQAFIFETDIDCVVACRGTEPNEWNDIKADIDAVSVAAETIGRVHRGFKKEVDDLWPILEQRLISNQKTLWFCGHSLGGAMAAICAGRCYLSHIESMPKGLFTYGSPRVGNMRYVNHVQLEYFRWVNNNDIVTHVPPSWMNYRHTGQEMYINAYGRVREMTGWQRTKDRWRGLVMGIKQGKIDSFADHSIDLYIAAILAGLEKEREGAMDAKSANAVNKAAAAELNPAEITE
ncbi:MAG: lipase family protein [Acidiferrobacterales bacterium]|nr:lipase family protein [Acidiferrobacterales bacterium]